MSELLADDEVVTLAERVNAGTIDVGAQIEKFGKDALATIDRLQREKRDLRAALEDIAKGNGAFSRDQYTFACNVIENMKSIATRALAGTYERE